MAYVKGENRQQIAMFPEIIDDYVAEDNPVRVIEAFVMSLDMSELGFERAHAPSLGRPAYDPRDLLKLYLYGYLNRIRSSRKLESEASRNLEVIWLISGLKPDFKTIADFRKDNKDAVKKVFKQFSVLCKKWGLYGQTLVAVDGSKFRASNSKKKNFNEKKLNRHLKHIDTKIEQYLNELEEGDQSEANTHKPSADEINQHIQELQERKAKYEEMLETIKENKVSEISLTDADARQMSTNNNGLDICYNVQTVVDGKHSMVVDYDVINNPADLGQLNQMAKRAQNVFDTEEIDVLADKGYYSGEDIKECEDAKLKTYVAKPRNANATGNKDFYINKFQYDAENDHYICPAGHVLPFACYRKNKGEIIGRDYHNFKACKTCTLREHCTTAKRGRTIYRSIHQDLLDVVDKRTRENKELYTKRQMIVEHPFGTIKRSWGFSYFLTRGLNSVNAESGLAFLAYNITRATNILGVKEIVRRLQAA
jgi:transposase